MRCAIARKVTCTFSPKATKSLAMVDALTGPSQFLLRQAGMPSLDLWSDPRRPISLQSWAILPEHRYVIAGPL